MLVFLMVFSSVAIAVPRGPHVFYGTVLINGVPAPDGNLIEVKLSGITVASTITRDGEYKYNMEGDNVFYVPDDTSFPATGKTLKFYVKGVYAGDYVFENFAITQLDLSIVTECGNDLCEAGESSSSCCVDCGCSAGYSCTSGTCTVNTPPAPYCGDGSCGNGEDCATCSADCGTCPPSGGGFTPPPPEDNETEVVEELTCGDELCSDDETCSDCEVDCGVCPPECVEDIDCDDGDICTIDSCDESCSYEVVACGLSDSCCPSGCTISNDGDCSCDDACSQGSTNCVEGVNYACLGDNNGCLKWFESGECDVEFNSSVTTSGSLQGDGDKSFLESIGLTGAFVDDVVNTGKSVFPIFIILGLGVVVLFVFIKKKPIKKFY